MQDDQSLSLLGATASDGDGQSLSRWIQTGSGLFHLVGNPGSGKSTLMKYLWDHPKTRTKIIAWANSRKIVAAKCFLWKKGTKKQKSIAGLCRSLLYDILEECVELAPHAMPDLWRTASSTPWQVELKFPLRKEYVREALTRLLCDPALVDTHRFVIFVDGLDELREESSGYEEIVEMLLQWMHNDIKHVKLFASSRPLHEFLRAFPGDQRLWLHNHTRQDQTLIILDRLKASISPIGDPSSHQLDTANYYTELSQFADHVAQICAGDFRKLIWIMKRINQVFWGDGKPDSMTNERRELSTPDLKTIWETLNGLEVSFSQLDLDDQDSYIYGSASSHPPFDFGRDRHPATFQMLQIEHNAEHEEATRRKEIQEIETYFDISSSSEDDLFTAKDKRMTGTCEWFLAKPAYCNWYDLTAQTSRVLWVTGKPATGKSVLASHIIEELQNNEENCSFYFFKYSNPSKSLLSNCLISIACQMARHNSSVRENLARAMRENNKSVGENNNERLLWHKFFLNLIFKADLQKCFWVIDGLDECENSTAVFKTLLSGLSEDISLRILVTSRDTQTLRSAFAELGPENFRHETISTMDTLPDIRAFVEARSTTLISMKPETRLTLVEKIVEKSEGSFLWTSLVLKELSHTYSEDEIARVLEEVPKDMNPLYHRTLDLMSRSLGGKDIAKSIITWTTCALRPLKLDELEGALKFSGCQEISNLEATIHSTCGQLVIVDRFGNVQLVHETAREFLIADDLQSEFAVKVEDANTQITKACLGYLASDEMKKPRLVRRLNPSLQPKKQLPFANYACPNFSVHLAKADGSSVTVIESLSKFLSTNVLTWIEFIARTRSLNGLIQTSKHLKKYLTSCTAQGDLNFIHTWSTDLMRISARFAEALITCPPSIFVLIPPFCPTNSAVYKTVQQGRGLQVSGFANTEWGNRLTCLDFSSPASSLCHGHDYFAVGLSNGVVILYHAGTGQKYKSLGHGEAVNLLCFLNRSGLMASCGPKMIKIWDIASGEAKYTFQAPRRCIALTYDKGTLIAACDKNYLASWKLNDDGHRQPDKPWHAGDEVSDSELRRPPSAVAISIEHKMLAIASPGRPIILWSLEDDDYYGLCGKRLENGELSKHLVTAMVFNPNSALELLAVSYLDGDLALLDPFQGETLEVVRANCPKLAASPDGRLLAGAAGAGTIDVYGFESLKLVYRVKSSNLYVKQLDFSKDSLHFIDIRGSQCNVWEPAALRRASIVWDRTENAASFVESNGLSSNARTSALLMLGGQKFIICGKHDGSVSLYDAASAKEIVQLYKHKSKVHILAYSKTQKAIVSVDKSNSIIAWSLPEKVQSQPSPSEAGTEIFSSRLESQSTITQLLTSEKNGKFILSTRESDHLWALDPPGEIETMLHDTPKIRKWVQHPDDSNTVLRFDGNSVQAYKWLDWSLAFDIPVQLNMTGLQLKRIIPYTVGRNQSLLIEFSELHGGTNTRNVCLVDVSRASETKPSTSLPADPTTGGEQHAICKSSQQLPYSIMSLISHVIGFSDTRRLIFLDGQCWVCSLSLDQKIDKTVQYTRHFFVPYDWLSGSRGIVVALVGRKVVFSRNDGIAIIQGGFDYSLNIEIATEG